MAQKKKGPSKNQTAGNRAAEQLALANHPTKHVCMSDKCPKPNTHILLKDLLTAVAAPKRRKLYYHKDCWNNR